MIEAAPAKFVSPVLDLKAVQDIQIILEQLTWLQIVYPLAQVGVENFENNLSFKYPQVYKNDGQPDYYDIRPNDALRSYAFFELDNQYPLNEDEMEYSLSLIVWYNLKRIDSARTYDFSRELIKDIYRVIDLDPEYKFRISEIQTEVRNENVFDKYSFKQEDKQFLKYPYGAFKISFKVIDYLSQECFAFASQGNQT